MSTRSRIVALRTAGVPAIACLLAGYGPQALGQPADPKPGREESEEVSFPTQAQLGNIFALGQKVLIEATVRSGTSVDWVVSDFLGRKVDSGAATVSNGRVQIAPSAIAKGYYLVRLTSKSGAQARGEGRTSYAVLAPVAEAGKADPRFGVAGQYSKAMSTDTLQLLAKAGIVRIRDDVPWDHVEKVKGTFDFARTDPFMGALAKAGMATCVVMAFGNKHYDAQPGLCNYQAPPYTADGIAGYANYCVALHEHYGRQIQAAEIWNEYNGSFCAGRPAANRPKHYTAMLRAAYEKIKATRPDVTVVGGAMVKIPLPYCEKLFNEGALEYMDAIAVHPYMPEPEGVEEETAALVALTRKHNNGEAKPVWVTECGTWDDHSVERAHAASYLVRMYCLLLTQPQVAQIDWFLACDYAEFRNLGLLHGESDPMGRFTPVATYPAYANLIQQLQHARFVRREPTDPRTRVYRFQRQEHSVWVCWSTVGATQLLLAARRPVRLTDMVGTETSLAPADGQVAVTVDEWPVYITAGKGTVTTLTEMPRKDRVLADSETGFSDRQGAAGWSYLHYVSNQDGSAAYDPGQAQPMEWGPSPGDWEYRWAGPAQWYQVSRGGSHPAAIKGKQGWAVRRWTSDQDGPVHVVGQAARGSKDGDGVAIRIFLDGRELLTRMLAPSARADIDLSPTVRKGARLDFVVTPGAGLDTSYDATAFHVTILGHDRL